MQKLSVLGLIDYYVGGKFVSVFRHVNLLKLKPSAVIKQKLHK